MLLQVVRQFRELHEGPVTALEGSRSGRLLFTGGGDGLVLAHDLRMKRGSRALWHHCSPVAGLSFEDPWLASGCTDGAVVLQVGAGQGRKRRRGCMGCMRGAGVLQVGAGAGLGFRV